LVIHQTGLVELADQVRTRKIRPIEVVDHYLERTERFQPLFNAAISIDGERARQRALRLERQTLAGALAGIPVPIKDIFDHAGRVTTAGSGFYRNESKTSAPAVHRVENAGAVITARLGLHEFAFGFSSENHWFGPVRNPWDPATSPGGSSGGSAAAVAAGLAPASLGTDTGGSIRVPAALCGVVGLKVTHGRVPLAGVFPLAPSLDTVGQLGRSVADVAAVYAVTAGYHPADPWAAPRVVEQPTTSTLEGLVVGVPQPWVDKAPMTSEVKAAFEWALGRLAALGAIVAPVRNPVLLPPGKINELAWGEIATVHRRWWGTETYGPETAGRLEAAMAVTLDQYVEAQAWRSRLRNLVADVFSAVDLLVTPTVPAMRKLIGEDVIEAGGQPLPYRTVLSWFSALVNHMGCPALSVPLAVDGSPPPSLQLIAPWWREARLLEAGRALEEAGVAGVRWPPGI
jgi:aspartyl-tRNA(Asn)/glutamyl-tRNA(Gln) amidotransferase subunit A